MSCCNQQIPATFCDCKGEPTGYEATIGPVEDNGTLGYLKQIDGQWWMCCNQGTPVRVVSDEELAEALSAIYSAT